MRERSACRLRRNPDAFADATKAQIGDIVRSDLGGVDLLVYSLAAPVRTDPNTGVLYRAVIKPIGHVLHTKTLNVEKGLVDEADLAPATLEEIQSTVKVMGGEDWERWVVHLHQQRLLNPGFKTVAYTYIGSGLTWPIYWEGTLGKAKEDLDRVAAALRTLLEPLGGDARVAVLKAVVTQASSAIPAVPLYISILFKVMKQMNLHEDCIRHIDRLFRGHLYNGSTVQSFDDVGRWRLDGWELREDVQTEVQQRWARVNTAPSTRRRRPAHDRARSSPPAMRETRRLRRGHRQRPTCPQGCARGSAGSAPGQPAARPCCRFRCTPGQWH